MARRRARTVFVLACVSIAVAIAACDAGDGPRDRSGVDRDVPTTATTATTAGGSKPSGVRTIEVAFENGAVVGGPRRETVALGAQVRIVVTADRDEEVHVHTYDLSAEVASGSPAEVTFTASIPGVHEVELHRAHRVLFTLEVR